MTSRSTNRAERPADGRGIVRANLEGVLAEDSLEIAELLVSELVTNAIVHGSGEATLLIEVEDARVHVEVVDSEATADLAPRQVDPSSEHGRGLAIVNRLATSWGVEPRYVGKAVWFDLSR